jgi:hypothetical protein
LDGATTSVKESTDAVLEALVPAIDRARTFAERWPGEYRAEIFRIALGRVLNMEGSLEPGLSQPSVIAARGVVHSTVGESPALHGNADAEHAGATSSAAPAEKLASHLGLSSDALRRAVHFDDGGRVAILGRIEGRSRRELQLKYSMVYLYVKEFALATRLVDVEELRAICIQNGCYDQANFTANFRRESARVREDGTKGARTRRYMLTQRGISEAEALLREMVSQ